MTTWISFEDEFPEEGIVYDLWTPYEDDPEGVRHTDYTYNKKKDIFEDGPFKIPRAMVTHFMPKPGPPQL